MLIAVHFCDVRIGLRGNRLKGVKANMLLFKGQKIRQYMQPLQVVVYYFFLLIFNYDYVSNKKAVVVIKINAQYWSNVALFEVSPLH